MAVTLQEWADRYQSPHGGWYTARACARQRDDDLWEGWLEFDPVEAGETLRTGRETTQPKFSDIQYWATGLTAAYIDGALRRITTTPEPIVPPQPQHPVYDAPAPHPRGQAVVDRAVAPRAVLDPFAVYASGDDVLRDQLTALSEGQLRNIIRAHGLGGSFWGELERMSQAELSLLILKEVRQKAG